MKCSKCQFENREVAKFCIKCGEKFEINCPNCGNSLSPEALFCDKCGHTVAKLKEALSVDYSQPQSYTPKFLADKILTTRSSIEGERKLVTVLFADVANYTTISEKLDPEEVHQIMDGCFKILMDEIHKFEGTINQFTGDGVMALFGAPVAHEDHAQRACHAALSIQKALEKYTEGLRHNHGIDFKMRIGLNSGNVVVGSIGDDLRMDYTAIGDTTNLASRMEGMAKPGRSMVSENTYTLARDFFEFKPLGKVQVKGKKEALESYELIEPSKVETRIEASAARGLSKFVGRGREMAALKETFEKTRSVSGQVIGVVGEAGVGKSRLLIEFRSILPKGNYTYLEGRCLHYGGSTAYLPVLDILRSYFDIKEGDRQFAIKEKIEEKVRQLDEKLMNILPPFQEILSLPVDDGAYLKVAPVEKKRRTFEAIRDLFVRVSETQPLVLAVEDLHWIDKTSEEFLNYLIDWLANTNILLILLYRPEYTHQWGSKSHYSKIGVDQLSTGSSADLVEAILEGGDVVPELRELILGKAGGNPLFVEELIQSLLENGSIQRKGHEYVLIRRISEIEVPDTLQAIIAARIDRIEENLKRLMQVASVIGREFAFRILRTIMGIGEELKSQLLYLQGLEFILKKSLFPELEYIFKHALTQEVAYQSLLGQRRKELHCRVGMAMEAIFAERLGEFYNIVGDHFLHGEMWERAADYLIKAGDAAARLYAHAEARIHYIRALEALSHLPNTTDNSRQRIDSTIKLVSVSFVADPPDKNLARMAEAEQLLDELSVSDQVGGENRLRLARIHFWMGRLYYYKGEMGKALGYYQQVLSVAQELGDEELLAIPSTVIGRVMMVRGQFSQAKPLLAQAADLLEKAANWTEWVYTIGFLGGSKALCGQYAEGVTQIERALAQAVEMNYLTGIAVNHIFLCIICLQGGELDRVVEESRAVVNVATQSQDQMYVYMAHGFRAWAESRLGNQTAAVESMDRAKTIGKELGQRLFFTDWFAAADAEIAFNDNRMEDALTIAEQGVSMAQSIGGGYAEGVAHRVWGQALAAIPGHQWNKAEEHLAQSLHLFASGKARLEIARTHVVWGLAYRDRGELNAAREQLEKASAQWETSGVTWELKKVQMLLASLPDR